MNSVPQHLSIITLGTNDLSAIRAFYARWGWRETEGSEDTWCAFDLGGVLLSFYSMSELAVEAGADPRSASEWGGYTLAVNARSSAELRSMFDAALEAGATLVADLQNSRIGVAQAGTSPTLTTETAGSLRRADRTRPLDSQAWPGRAADQRRIPLRCRRPIRHAGFISWR